MSAGNGVREDPGSLTRVGQFSRPFKLEGEIRIRPTTFDPERLELLARVFACSPDDSKQIELCIRNRRLHRNEWFLTFEGYASPEEVAVFSGWNLMVPDSERLPLPAGRFYFSDLAGLDVLDDEGRTVGKVIEVTNGSSNDIFKLRIRGKEILVPWIKDCIAKVDLQKSCIRIHLDYLEELL